MVTLFRICSNMLQWLKLVDMVPFVTIHAVGRWNPNELRWTKRHWWIITDNHSYNPVDTWDWGRLFVWQLHSKIRLKANGTEDMGIHWLHTYLDHFGSFRHIEKIDWVPQVLSFHGCLFQIRPHRRCWGVIVRMALVKGYRFTWGVPFFGQNLLFLIGRDARLQKTL